MRILFFGDIVGKIGRRAIAKILPELKSQFKPDLVLANAENLAHGKGVTVKTVREVLAAGVDWLTSGNHIWSKKKEFKKVLAQNLPVIRPANYLGRFLGKGWAIIKIKNVLLINLLGRVFIKDKPRTITNPFRRIDRLLLQIKPLVKIIFVDFHGEATAEKKAFGHWVDGRVSAVLGTHTHIQTADEQILSKGTAYITDVGMVGAKDSVIGFRSQDSIKRNLISGRGRKPRLEIPKKGRAIINAALIDIDSKTGKAIKIKRIAREVEIC